MSRTITKGPASATMSGGLEEAVKNALRRCDPIAIPIMEKAVRAKFVNPTHGLMEKLLATGDAIIGEANPRDKYWGIGTSADTADAKNPAKWKGQNQLGKILMKLREEFKQAKAE